MKRSVLGLVATIVIAGAAVGDRPAEAVWFNPGGMGMGYGLGWGGYGGYGWGGGGTAAGNYMMGQSQVIRAEGQYNKDTSEAYINYEDARTKYIDNKKKWTETYFSMREQNQSRQAEKLERSRHSPETLAQAARSGVPKPLSSDAYDPISGRVTWPEALQATDYAALREDVEHLLELRTSTSGGGSFSIKLRQDIEKMTAILKSNIQNLPTNDYISARKFLDSLSFAVRS